jgi:hypothetical protein
MQYEWKPAMGIADFVLREVIVNEGDTTPADTLSGRYTPPRGFIMKSSPTTYIAWIPNDAGNRMEFFDVETAKAWVFTQVRMSGSNALLTEDT